MNYSTNLALAMNYFTNPASISPPTKKKQGEEQKKEELPNPLYGRSISRQLGAQSPDGVPLFIEPANLLSHHGSKGQLT